MQKFAKMPKIAPKKAKTLKKTREKKTKISTAKKK